LISDFSVLIKRLARLRVFWERPRRSPHDDSIAKQRLGLKPCARFKEAIAVRTRCWKSACSSAVALEKKKARGTRMRPRKEVVRKVFGILHKALINVRQLPQYNKVQRKVVSNVREQLPEQ